VKPDILIFASKSPNIISISHEILKHPAIKRGLPGTRIVLLPSSLLSCGTPNSVEAVELLASAIA
ncbi:MAG: hypothetical protein PHS88_06855, partial [Candidatus Omnitrophica bacterium]|nr:hypothetical protein [Candidatus Omnitrophota bacterium]